MTRYVLSPAARADLDEIWDFSARHWGADRADHYIRAIRDACAALADGRRLGRPIDHVRPGYRRLEVASHVLFYRHVAGGVIDVVRVLHQRMNVPDRLPP